MEIVINIPDRIHYGIDKGITVNGSEASQIVLDAVKNGTPLPKGHGRLIDADALNFNADYNEPLISKLDFDWAPTIIEAEKEREEK